MSEELPQRRRRSRAPRPKQQPLSAGAYIGLSLGGLVATFLAASGMHYAAAQPQPVLRSIYYVLLWVLGITSALFLFGVLPSAASISGRQWGANIEIGGPAALAVLVVLGGYEFAKTPKAFSLPHSTDGRKA